MKNTLLRPMLAEAADDLEVLPYPLLASYKMDGIRALVTPQGARTRSMKAVPNKHMRALLAALPHGLDGEIGVVGDDGAVKFRETTSAFKQFEGEPKIKFFVFDDYLAEGVYVNRVLSLMKKHMRCPDWVIFVEQRVVQNADEVRAMFAEALDLGHEGLILRRHDAPYKMNRSTLREAFLLKVKPWKDAEATLIEVLPQFENTNEKTRDERGFAKRSSKKAGKVQRERAGAFLVQNLKLWPKPFEIGTFEGFTHGDLVAFWHDRAKLVGETARFSYVTVGGYDVPRHCKFHGFRAAEDMDEEQ